MKRFTIIISILISTSYSYSQTSNGRVSSLVAAENYFGALVKEKGIRHGFLKVSDNETLVFRPDPIKAEDFYDKRTQDDGQLSWEPVYAKISRSGDWGFTTGPYAHIADSTSYGQFLSVWKANKKGVWKLALDVGIPHPKPKASPDLNFTDPKNFKFFRQISESRLKQREDMIMTSDRLFSNTIKKNRLVAYDAFLANEARLLFPGYEPIIGKENINNFYSLHEINIAMEPAVADRALGSDLAFTYGTAHISQNSKSRRYNYVRIWESQEGFKWNVIVELFSPAE